MISRKREQELEFIFHIYDEAYSKAFADREFSNPCESGTDGHYAWIAGTREGKRMRPDKFPNAIASVKGNDYAD